MYRLIKLEPVFRARLLETAKQLLPEFVMDDDWPDARDKLAGQLEEHEYPSDMVEDVVDDVMIEVYLT